MLLGLFRETEAHGGVQVGIFGGLAGEMLPRPSEHQHLPPPPFLTHPFLPSPAFGAHPPPIPHPEHPPHPLAVFLPQRLFWDGILAAPHENSLKIELEGSVRAGRAGWRRRRPLGVRSSRPRCFLTTFRGVFLH